MIHQYKNNGYNIVLDVNSGCVHVVDEIAYGAVEAEVVAADATTGVAVEVATGSAVALGFLDFGPYTLKNSLVPSQITFAAKKTKPPPSTISPSVTSIRATICCLFLFVKLSWTQCMSS